MNIALILVVGYFVGSIPTAYLMVRRTSGLDIRKEGSGNVGAFNTFDVTKSKIVGITVGLLDALKGFAVTACLTWVFRVSFEFQVAGLLAVIVGHNYPVWLKFKGGRGLATGAGGLIAVGWMYTLIWCVAWGLAYLMRKDILLGNLVAILVTPFSLLIIPGTWIQSLAVVDFEASSFRAFAFILSGLLLLSHIDAINDLRTKRRVGNE